MKKFVDTCQLFILKKHTYILHYDIADSILST